MFDEPVVLDRSLGADAHFGTGQFLPVCEQAEAGIVA